MSIQDLNEFNRKRRQFLAYFTSLGFASTHIYNAGGAKVMKKLWTALKKHTENMSDDAFVKMLKKEVHPSVADVYLKWNAK